MLPEEESSVGNMGVSAVGVESQLQGESVLVTAAALRRGVLAAPGGSYTSTALVHASK